MILLANNIVAITHLFEFNQYQYNKYQLSTFLLEPLAKKVCSVSFVSQYILYIVTEKTLDPLSHIVSSVRFKTGTCSQKEIQVVALNKTGTQCIYQCFSQEWGWVTGIPWGLDSPNSHCPREFDRRLWHRGGTLDVSARKLKL